MKGKLNLAVLTALIGISSVTVYAGEMTKATTTKATTNHVKFCADLGKVDVTDKIKVKNSSHVKDFVVCQTTNTNISLKAQSSTSGELSVIAPSGEFMVMTDYSDGSKIYETPMMQYSYTGPAVSKSTVATADISVGNFCSLETELPMLTEVVLQFTMTCDNAPTAATMTSKMAAYAPAQSGIRGDAEKGIVTYNE